MAAKVHRPKAAQLPLGFGEFPSHLRQIEVIRAFPVVKCLGEVDFVILKDALAQGFNAHAQFTKFQFRFAVFAFEGAVAGADGAQFLAFLLKIIAVFIAFFDELLQLLA